MKIVNRRHVREKQTLAEHNSKWRKKKCSSREAINNQAESLARSRSLLLCLSARHFYICFALINIVVCIDVKIISATTTEH